MKKLLTILIALTVALTVGAQNADKLYKEAKALLDAKNYTEAVPKLQQAADKGHKKAQYRLGKCYKEGWGVEKDRKKATQYYALSARQGYAKAQYQLGKAYLKGKGVPADEQQAKSWLTKAVKDDKHGKEILDKMRAEAASGDADAKKMLTLIGK